MAPFYLLFMCVLVVHRVHTFRHKATTESDNDGPVNSNRNINLKIRWWAFCFRNYMHKKPSADGNTRARAFGIASIIGVSAGHISECLSETTESNTFYSQCFVVLLFRGRFNIGKRALRSCTLHSNTLKLYWDNVCFIDK